MADTKKLLELLKQARPYVQYAAMTPGLCERETCDLLDDIDGLLRAKGMDILRRRFLIVPEGEGH